ncbi:MAG: hypothetical protein ACOCWQ_04435 [Nanoarchaeota archaeon]
MVQVIPKEVAQNVNELVFPGKQPTVLQADPIIEWIFADVKKGQDLQMVYLINGRQTDPATETLTSYTQKNSGCS